MGRQKNECIYSSHSTHLLHNTSPRTPHPNYKDGAAPRLISNLRLTAPVLWRRQWQLRYSCLENPTGRGAWWAAVHGVAKSRTRLSDFTFTFHFHALEEEMAAHSSVLAWRLPGTGEPGGMPSMGSHRVGHD